jgi:hypothetical protein
MSKERRSDMNMKRMVCAAIGLGLLALLLGGIVWAVVGQGDGTTPATAAPQVWSVENARQFKDFPVYWVGESFQGLPLVAVHRMDYPGDFPGKPYNHPWHEVSFDYGDCTIAPGEESCTVPLTIAIRPYCEVPPEVIADAVKTGPPEEIRGAVAQMTGKSQVRLWTSNVTIGIHATDEAIVDEAARNLVRLNGDKATDTGEDLGPPDKINCP